MQGLYTMSAWYNYSEQSTPYDWAREWQLGISVEKCCVLNIGTNISIPELHLESGALSVCHEVRDLGIVVSDCLSPSAHVAEVVGSAATRVHVARCCYVLFIIIIIILFVHKNNFIKTRQPTTRERDRQG